MARSPISSDALPKTDQPSHAPPTLDKKDREVVYELEQDSRRSLGQIAKKVGLSKQTLHYRIERLMKEGAISSFVTTIDASKLGYANHDVWIQLGMMEPKRKKALIDYLVEHPKIRLVATCGGKFDILIGILAESIPEYNSILKNIQVRFLGDMKNHFTNISSESSTYPRSYLVEGYASHEERKGRTHGSGNERAGADMADLAIVGALARNARAETVEIARKAKIAPNTVRAKMKRLHDTGIIQGYSIVVQPCLIGIQSYVLLINTHEMGGLKEKEIERFCIASNNVTSLFKTVGKWDICIGFEVEGDGGFQDFLFDFRTRFADIIKEYEYVPILYIHKYDSFPMAERH